MVWLSMPFAQLAHIRVRFVSCVAYVLEATSVYQDPLNNTSSYSSEDMFGCRHGVKVGCVGVLAPCLIEAACSDPGIQKRSPGSGWEP